MSKRMIDASMLQNEKVGELPMQARLLLIGMILLADDQGRVKANPSWLRSQIFTYDNIEADDVCQALCGLSDNDTITVYEVDGKQYAQFINWWNYQNLQYAQPSKFPKPKGWHDRIRYTFTKGVILTCNWVLGDGKATTDTCDESGKPLTKQAKAVKSDTGNQSPETPKDLPNEQSSIQVNNQVDNQVNVQDKDKDYDQDKDHDQERDIDTTHTRETPPSSLSADTSPTEQPQQTEPQGIDPTILEQMSRWSKDKPKAPRVRIDDKQAAIVAAQSMTDAPTDVKAAKPLQPTVSPDRVVSSKDGSITIPVLEWVGMMDVLLSGLGLKELADANVSWVRPQAVHTLETLVKVAPMYRNKAGIEALFKSWQRARPNAKGSPKPDWILTHAADLANGKVRYPDQATKKQGVLANADPNFRIEQFTGAGMDFSGPEWQDIKF